MIDDSLDRTWLESIRDRQIFCRGERILSTGDCRNDACDYRDPSDTLFMNSNVEYEVFDEYEPSYLSAYIMSVFVLLGIGSVAQSQMPLWPITMAHVFLVVWFGVLFKWILDLRRVRRVVQSSRLSVTNGLYKHSVRYAVEEYLDFEIPLAEIESIKLSTTEPQYIKVTSKTDEDVYFLPENTDFAALSDALLAGNEDIWIET